MKNKIQVILIIFSSIIIICLVIITILTIKIYKEKENTIDKTNENLNINKNIDENIKDNQSTNDEIKNDLSTNKTITQNKQSESQNKKYICPNGYNLDGTNCKKIISIDAEKKLVCKDGGVLRGTGCYFSVIDSTENNNKCPYGGQWKAYDLKTHSFGCYDVKNYIFSCDNDNYEPGNIYGKPFGCLQINNLSENDCGSIDGVSYYYNGNCHNSSPEILPTTSCPTDYHKHDGQCYKEYEHADEYICPEGYTLSNDNTKCTKKSYIATEEYVCEDGYKLTDTKCIKEIIIEASEN